MSTILRTTRYPIRCAEDTVCASGEESSQDASAVVRLVKQSSYKNKDILYTADGL